ncbi:damage-inducible protein CinA [Salinibacter sp. 10B]|uniref:competence/damage-inducible protein A n=1 Tax=Salinibacter sp. 10B TaxID=1923971 RepID=UPI000CF51ACE|nr:competence/damage-inducible protein A [Salinibacter sp. 10B]PQJ34171.1 damage-inducible protein CinA [Salinibacter sp. 10B]
MNAHLLTIGDELLIGQTTNTNAAWLGERLSRLGLEVERTVTVGDDPDRMREELDRSARRADLIVITGGLGPTHDDVTRDVVADYFEAPLQTDEAILDRIRRYYERRGRQMPASGPTLAQVPQGFETLENPVGAAVGLWHEATVEGQSRLVVILPGIPEEMKGIFSEAVQPRLEARDDVRGVHHRTLVTSGIGESSLQERLGDLVDTLPDDLRLAYLPSTDGVRLRLTTLNEKPDGAENQLDQLEASIRERAGEHVIGTGDVMLEEVLGDRLRATGTTIGSAESATGGLIGHRLTGVSGSSDYYDGSVVSYANRVKRDILGVEAETLDEFGAVSEPVAVQMAEGVRQVLGVDIGIATTGIAGPTGGTDEKPVGTVWLGYADAHRTRAIKRHFVEDRTLNKQLFATAALDLARRELASRSEEGEDWMPR